MTVFSVHIPPATTGKAQPETDRVKFVADKFSWPALFFGPAWLVWHRMWWIFAGYIMVAALLPMCGDLLGVNDMALSWITLAVMILFALEAPVLRRWSLARKGYELATFLSGHDVQDCEVKFFSNWGPEKVAKPGPKSMLFPGQGLKQTGSNVTETGVIGLFPTPGAEK